MMVDMSGQKVWGFDGCSTGAIAEVLGVSRETVRRWVVSGVLKGTRSGPMGNWRVPIREVNRFKLQRSKPEFMA